MIKAAMEQGCFGPVMPVHHFPLPAVFYLMAETFKGWPLARGLRRNRTPQIFFLNISWTWLTTLLTENTS